MTSTLIYPTTTWAANVLVAFGDNGLSWGGERYSDTLRIFSTSDVDTMLEGGTPGTGHTLSGGVTWDRLLCVDAADNAWLTWLDGGGNSELVRMEPDGTETSWTTGLADFPSAAFWDATTSRLICSTYGYVDTLAFDPTQTTWAAATSVLFDPPDYPDLWAYTGRVIPLRSGGELTLTAPALQDDSTPVPFAIATGLDSTWTTESYTGLEGGPDRDQPFVVLPACSGGVIIAQTQPTPVELTLTAAGVATTTTILADADTGIDLVGWTTPNGRRLWGQDGVGVWEITCGSRGWILM